MLAVKLRVCLRGVMEVKMWGTEVSHKAQLVTILTLPTVQMRWVLMLRWVSARALAVVKGVW